MYYFAQLLFTAWADSAKSVWSESFTRKEKQVMLLECSPFVRGMMMDMTHEWVETVVRSGWLLTNHMEGVSCTFLKLVLAWFIRGRRTGDCSMHREAVRSMRSISSSSYSSRAGSTSSATEFLYSKGFACQKKKLNQSAKALIYDSMWWYVQILQKKTHPNHKALLHMVHSSASCNELQK